MSTSTRTTPSDSSPSTIVAATKGTGSEPTTAVGIRSTRTATAMVCAARTDTSVVRPSTRAAKSLTTRLVWSPSDVPRRSLTRPIVLPRAATPVASTAGPSRP
jgi:hypothetical protein